ncbi:MAG: cysteine desulfurase [Candidatus Cloacimonetes bacterium]|nr:cysteine desulfurase [Candidatus Cloacimonadota bacterium]
MAYFDYNATHPVSQKILAELPGWAAYWQNPSSRHRPGQRVRGKIEEARETIAACLGVLHKEIFFTSGGTESNHLALQGLSSCLAPGSLILSSPTEHPCLLGALNKLKSRGFQIQLLPVDCNGVVTADVLKKHIHKASLVSLMQANNETGAITDLHSISSLCREAKVLLHTDAVQALGKMELDLSLVDAASLSAHKIGGLKGTGALFLRTGLKPEPVFLGGEQEKGIRPGTENSLGILSFAAALKERSVLSPSVSELRDRFESGLYALGSGYFQINGGSKRVGNTSSVTFFGFDGQSLVLQLDMAGHFVSMGAACSSGSVKPSPVLIASGLSEADAKSTLRISFGCYNEASEVDSLLHSLRNILGLG